MALTYRQLSENHLADTDLRSRSMLAAAKYAAVVSAEASNTAGHAQRAALARFILLGGADDLANRVHLAVVGQMTGLSGINSRAVPDAEIDTAVVAAWNAMAGV